MAMSTHDNLREIQMNNISESDFELQIDEVYSSDDESALRDQCNNRNRFRIMCLSF
jgi:hypothetical protein